jgi:hypothetical protein
MSNKWFLVNQMQKLISKLLQLYMKLNRLWIYYAYKMIEFSQYNQSNFKISIYI